MSPDHADGISVKERSRTYVVPFDTIDWVQVDGKYVVLHVGADRHYVRGSLPKVDVQLPANMFAQVDRDAIVNLAGIAELRPTGNGDYTIVMKSGAEVALGRRYRSRLPELFGRAG